MQPAVERPDRTRRCACVSTRAATRRSCCVGFRGSYALKPARRSCYARGWAAVRVMPGCTRPRRWESGGVPCPCASPCQRSAPPARWPAPGASRKAARGGLLLCAGPTSQRVSAGLGRWGVPTGVVATALRPLHAGVVGLVRGTARSTCGAFINARVSGPQEPSFVHRSDARATVADREYRSSGGFRVAMTGVITDLRAVMTGVIAAKCF